MQRVRRFPASQRIAQPANKGTAPPILYSLLSIELNDKEAIAANLPCDHHYSDEQTFTAALESAFDIAAHHTGSVALLGAHPQGPEVDYGWIEPGPSACGASFHVRGLPVQTRGLAAPQLGRTGWSDLEHRERVMAVLQTAGLEPWWMKEWQAPRRRPAVVAPLTHPAVA
ncbi:MAG: hypothetical protein JJE04_18965 [Acidobacteriia bacterium]|nr:hypothetical protein [Terriglobia bacterium]